MKIDIGDEVVTLKDVEPYYSGYAGNPKVIIPKGSFGLVGAVKCPYVNKKGYFNCVDFLIPGVFQGDAKFNDCTWRASLTNKEIKVYRKYTGKKV